MPDIYLTLRQFLRSPLVRRMAFLGLLLAGAGIAGLFTFGLARNLVTGTGLAGSQAPQISEEQATAQALNPLSAPSTPNPNAPSSQPELTPWDGASRVTVLLIGLDYRDWQSGEGASRSDTMILLTLDPLTKTAGMLSIPRDMWVAIPGFQHGKINTAYYLGEAYKLPGGGPGLAVKTVEQFLGVPVNYYAQIDFGAFVKFIDELGGIKIDVPAKITVDLLGSGASTKKTLQPGVQVLPGEWALAYARNRYTEGGDFDRAQRQQQVILGIRDRILSLDMLPTLIQKAPSMYQDLSSGVHTNLTLEQVVRLALLAKDVPGASIKQGVLNEKYVLFGTSPDGLSIVIPLPDKIHTLRDEIFATSGSLSPQTPGDSTARMQAESASVAVYNGSGTGGLENQTAELLRSQGMNVVSTGAAGERYANTTVLDHTGNPFTMRYLVDLIGISEFRIQLAYDPSSPVGVELFLGDDWARKIP
jgi:LCP family protein required for cell wall assembly